MFSSIKSYLFGASFAAPSSAAKADAADSSAAGNQSASRAERNEPASLLEQTLNAATTKITEQLLPVSASIEQLQSSSHQLLPTLNEQHEEDELKKQKEQNQQTVRAELDDDDDECFNDNSWELLDLVERPQSGTLSSTAAVQDVVVDMAGELGSNYGARSGSAGPSALAVQRQKLKVSFKTPDLVTEEQKIESDLAVVKPKAAKKKPKAKNKQTSAKESKEHKPGKIELTPTISPVVGSSVSLDEQSGKNKVENVVAAKPVLNYAQVLKPKPNEKIVSTKEATKEQVLNMAGTKGGLKRNRPLSTSSWSLSEESDAGINDWDDIQVVNETIEELPPSTDIQPEQMVADNNAINESMLSSNFSDIDCRYQEMNDFILKPKKGRKKQKRPSASSLSFVSKRITSNQSTKQTDAKDHEELVASMGEKPKTTPNKEMKPRKKKVALSTEPISSSVEFVKKNSGKVSCKASYRAGVESKKISSDSTPTGARSTVSSSSISSSCGSADSSDAPDMDESWFVTPPPCFTKAEKTSARMKLKQACRENELIEHPSVYISGGTKENEERVDTYVKMESGVKDLLEVEQSIASATLKPATQRKKSAMKAKKVETKLSRVSSSKISESEYQKSTISLGNKFIVTHRALNDQDDINDFDNMFDDECSMEEIVKSPKRVPKFPSNGKKNRRKQKTAEQVKVDTPSTSKDSDEYDSDFCVSSPVPAEIDESSISEPVEILVEENDGTTREEDSPDPLNDENSVPSEEREVPAARRKVTSTEKRAPIQVQPIEPERKPGWQLKRKRNKRRSTSSSMLLNQGTIRPIKDQYSYPESSSNPIGVRSTSNIIDRIGSSIVANLTNLTSNFSGSATIPLQPRAPMEEIEKLNNTVVRKSNSDVDLVNRRKLSKSYIDRQNVCAKVGNSNRRERRNTKMHKTLNGYSVNRKVQTNYRKVE